MYFFSCIALTVGSGILDGSVDLVMGVQYSWSEPEEKEDQLRGLADCVSRRLDQGIVNQYVCDLYRRRFCSLAK